MVDVSTASAGVLCKICNNETELHGCVDANRSCEIQRGAFPALSGVPIYYQRCLTCGFLFTTAFDGWSLDDFRNRIYDTGYAAADPDYATGSRARRNAVLTAEFMRRFSTCRVLDYGGGDGTLATSLRERGLDAHSWDLLLDGRSALPPTGTFPLVTAFEVFEHSPTPIETALDALSMVEKKGRLLFSTLLLDRLPRFSTDHWYIAPRNGHVSLHTRLSLQRLFSSLGWGVRSFDSHLHLAERFPGSMPD
jgi:hypothetical protein